VNRALAALALISAISLAACDGDDEAASEPTVSPVATSTARADVTPTGEPPQAAGTPVALGYEGTPVFPQLDYPQMLGLFIVPGNGQRALLLTKDGIVRLADLNDDAAEPSVYLDLTGRLIADPGMEEGLLGLAFAPDFEDSGALYVYYTAGGPRRSVVSRFTATGDAADPASEEVILEVEQPFRNHNGGMIDFGPDGYLYIALGDGGSGGDPMGNGQNPGTLLGSILRIDVSGNAGYEIPSDNPFVDGGGRGEVWAYGLRNPWRFTFDAETGEMWAADVGQNRVEEVDHIVRGGNYGWNIMEGDECFGADSCDVTGLVPPRAVYPRADGNCSVTGGYVYRGSELPELDGWYVYGDFCSGRVWAVNTEDNSPPVQLAETQHSISSFAVDAEGEIYMVTFHAAILRLTRASG
jgi:glucose/arabinose dehydrogenase